MWEVMALVLGAAIGTGSFVARRDALLTAGAGVGCVIAGVFVAVASGEAAESWGFVLFDTAQALAAAVCVRLLLARTRPRRASEHERS